MTARLSRDQGFSLMELMVASALFVLVILVAGGIFMGTLAAQQQVGAVTRSATDGQLAGTVIDDSVRNSIGFRLTAVGPDQLLVTKVAGGATTVQWTCVAFYYSAADGGSIRTRSSTPGTLVTAPTAAQLPSWTLLLDGVEPRTGTTIFTASGDTLDVSFEATADEFRAVAIEFASSPLAGVRQDSTCY